MRAAKHLRLVLLALATIGFGAETREVTVAANTMSEIRLDTSAGNAVDIEWEARQPATQDWWNTHDGGQVFCFWSGPAGQRLVVSDVIDWDARKRTKTFWRVTVEGNGPPPPPPPDEIPNKYGVGKITHAEATKIAAAHRTKCEGLAKIYESAASKLAGLSGDPVALSSMASSQVFYDTSDLLGKGETEQAWRRWRNQMKVAFETSWRNSDRTKDHTVGMFREIAAALRLVKMSSPKPRARQTSARPIQRQPAVRTVRPLIWVEPGPVYCPT